MNVWCHFPTIFSQRRALRTAGLIALCVAITTTLFFSAPSRAAVGTNEKLSFSGRLMNNSGGIVADGHYNIQFKIYQDGSGANEGNTDGTLKWTETYINNNGTGGVEVKNGYFSVDLGTNNPFASQVDWNQSVLWLSMNVAGSATACTTFDTAPCEADGEMLSMKRLTSTPYAMNAAKLGGLTAAQFIQNTATLQSGANLALQSASDSSITAYIEGRTSQTSTNLLIKQGSSQTGKALDIQGSSGSSLFNIDQSGALNQAGTASFGGRVNVSVSNTSTNNLPLKVAQTGTGDSGVEISATGTSKYSVGIDATDGTFKIASSVAAGATSNLGQTTVGASSSTSNYQHGQANKWTASQTGPVMNMSIYMNSVDSFCPNIQLGIYADNGSGTQPGALLGSSTESAATAGWNTKQLTSTVNITSGTIYWLAVYTDCDDSIALTTGTGTRAHKNGAGNLTDPFGQDSSSNGVLSLYATIDTSSGLADTFGGSAGILTLGATGNTTFKNSTDSSSAFQVQNSAGADRLSVNNTTTGGAANVQIGARTGSGTTLLTLDKVSSAPSITDSAAFVGSMYYDTTIGKVQCYEADGWGACGSAPDNFVKINPEYANAVMNGTDIGTISSDLCSDALNINDSGAGTTVCGTNETYNFYKWTSGEGSTQTRSIYVNYQLPSTFKAFIAGSTSLKGRTDSSNSSVTYQVYKDHPGSALASCGSAVSVSTGSQSTWQTGTASGSADPSNCSFVAGDSILIRINLSAHSNANAYTSTLGFTFSNN
jgi:hypothetical protein